MPLKKALIHAPTDTLANPQSVVQSHHRSPANSRRAPCQASRGATRHCACRCGLRASRSHRFQRVMEDRRYSLRAGRTGDRHAGSMHGGEPRETLRDPNGYCRTLAVFADSDGSRERYRKSAGARAACAKLLGRRVGRAELRERRRQNGRSPIISWAWKSIRNFAARRTSCIFTSTACAPISATRHCAARERRARHMALGHARRRPIPDHARDRADRRERSVSPRLARQPDSDAMAMQTILVTGAGGVCGERRLAGREQRLLDADTWQRFSRGLARIMRAVADAS